MRGRALGPGRLFKRGRSWTLDWTDETGKRHLRALSTDKRTAERIRSEIIRARDLALAGLGSEAGQDLTLAEILSAYLEDLEPRVSERHFKNVRLGLTRIVDELGEKRVRDLTTVDLTRIRARLTKDGRSNRTANLAVDRLRAMLNWAVDAALIAANPVARMKRLPESAGHRRYQRRALSEDEIERFLAASREDDEQCEIIADFVRVPQTVLWRAFLETGARYGELVRAGWGDLDFAKGLLTFRAENTKSKRTRVVPLLPELVETLRELRVIHESVLFRLPNVADPIFLSPEGRPWPWHSANLMRIFDRVLERAGIPKVDQQGLKLDVHALRHCFISRLARNGVELLQASRLAGHSDPKLTAQVYAHVDAEDLRGAIETLGSKAESIEEPAAKPEHRAKDAR